MLSALFRVSVVGACAVAPAERNPEGVATAGLWALIAAHPRLLTIGRQAQHEYEKIWPSIIKEDGLVVEGCLCNPIANLLK
jgi:hypothetical protein